MALMFNRIARNFAKKGYYPTDEVTLERILGALSGSTDGNSRVFDPCCGEGAALAEVKHHLGTEKTQAYGIEIDHERAWKAKSLLDVAIHGDLQDCILGQRSFGLLFLNPPYGALVSDGAMTGSGSNEKRLELLFYRRCVNSLQYGGILVMLIPSYTLDEALCTWIARSFERVQVFQAADPQFKQIVLFGVRRRQDSIPSAGQTLDRLKRINRKNGDDPELPDVIPASWSGAPYGIPATTESKVKFYHTRLNPEQLHEETRRFPCLWSQFPSLMNQTALKPRRPLTPMTDWHLALALAAGQVRGLVRSSDGRLMAVKGDTYKEQEVREHLEDNDKGGEILVTTKIDKFVPSIRGLDLTIGSETYGETIVIR